MKPDVIVLNPRDCLYPWWMNMVNKNHHLFGKVIIVMTQFATDLNFTNYIKRNLDAVVLESYPNDGKDWRHAAIIEALKYSDGETVLFLEQDFLFGKGFLEHIFSQLYPTIGFYEGDRLHPAFLLVQKDILDKTRKDFGVDPDRGDHFSKLTKDLEKVSSIIDLRTLTDSWYHLAGLTQNYRLTENWYQPQIFFEYNKLSQELPQHEVWKGICRKKEMEMGAFFPHPTVSLKEFFYET